MAKVNLRCARLTSCYRICRMKLHVVGVLGVLVAASFSIGCNPGSRSSQGPAKAPVDVISAMNAELGNTISTTTVTSEQMALPESRMPVAKWEDDEAPAPPLQTWGAAPEPPPPVDVLASGPFDRL
jgi:hypothetical protein